MLEISPESPTQTCAPQSREPSLNEIASHYSHPAWYAAYTCSRREKQVARVLQERNLECFLPLYEATRRHTHGGQRIFLPLFSGYVFVHIALQDRLCVLQVPGVVQLVSFNGRPAALQDSEIEALQSVLTRGLLIEPYPYLKVNHEVVIRSGPLQGLSGRILRRNGHFRVVMSVDLLRRSVVVDVDADDLSVRPLHVAA
jgi:transcriptional antiterminator NusG